MQRSQPSPMTERLRALTATGPDTDMGRLLRMFWQPVAVSQSIKPGKAKPLRVMGEDLTLYRGESGRAYLVAGRCAHRRTVLHTGWVQGEEIRCIYHGWKYAGSGQCTEAPGGRRRRGCAGIKIAGYPVHEYCGLDLRLSGRRRCPRVRPAAQGGVRAARPDHLARIQAWPCNWFQMIENSLDAVHVSFVHLAARSGRSAKRSRRRFPSSSTVETDAGIRQVATRSATNVRVSDWAFPNNNHIVTPGRTKTLPGCIAASGTCPSTTRTPSRSASMPSSRRRRRGPRHAGAFRKVWRLQSGGPS